MKKLTRLLLLLAASLSIACGTASGKVANGSSASNDGDKVASKVYFTKDIDSTALVRIYEAVGRPATGRVAVKISTGEPGGHNFLKPSLIGELVHKVNGTIVECNTAYGGKRSSTVDHIQAAKDHGFAAIATVDIMDSEGEIKIPVKDTKHIKYDMVGSHLPNYDFMINLAHFKGHAMGGFGGVLKNQSIGVASANGKAYIHTAGKVQTVEGLWSNIGDQDAFLESMAAAAQGVADHFGDNILYIDVMNNLSVDCDCDAHPHDPEMKDIGILASTDPVALDQACLDLVFNYTPKEGDNAAALIERINSRHGTHTVDYAETIGLGTKKYELINIDNNDNMSRKSLVAFFSATGTTKAVATRLASIAGADLFEIAPQKTYSADDLDWRIKNSRCNKENADENARPALSKAKASIEHYDVIYLGFPIWYAKAPKIINSFLESYDFSGKTIVLFATSGSDDLGRSAQFLKPSCSETTTIIDGGMLNGNPTDAAFEKILVK